MSADTPLSQKVQDLDRQIAAKIETLVKGLHSQIGERVRAATDDVVRWIEENAPEIPTSFLSEDDLSVPPAPVIEPLSAGGDFGLLLTAVSRLDTETGQAEILGGLLEESLKFSSRAAFFLIRQGQVRGWAGKGFGPGDETIAGIEEKADQDPWSDIQERGASLVCSDEQLAGMAIRISTSPAARAVLLPFAIRGHIAGVLYADAASADELVVPALQLLVHAAASALETSSVSPGLSPCLKLAESGEGEAASTAPEPETIDAAPAVEPVAAEPEVEAVVAEPVVDEPEPVVDTSAADTTVTPMAVPAVAPIESVNTEDLETTVVPAMNDEMDGFEAQAFASQSEMLSEPTVEFDAPALALGGPTPEPEPAPEPVFESVQVAPPSEEEIALEAEPEPELEMEDTNAWGSADEDEEEDEPTQIGMAAKLDPPEAPALEISESPPMSVPSPRDTVRLPAVSMEPEPPAAPAFAAPPVAPSFAAPVAPEPPPAPTFEAPSIAPVAPERPVAPTFVAPKPPSAPTFQVPAPASTFEAPPVAPAPPSSFADPIPPVAPAPPTSFADPVPSVAPAAPTSFADPVPPVAPAPEPASQVKPPSSSEVKPPSDLEGPGLAFATPTSSVAEDTASDSLHEEARRLARLLVSEIKLYNEEIIEEGRRTGNIYERLKDDIDRSRQMYEERIDPRLADQEDYFYQELVQRLAGGDTGLLGL